MHSQYYIITHTSHYIIAPTFPAEMHNKMRTLERASKALKSDKVQLNEQLSSLREQLSAKEKEVKELKGDSREANDEITRLRDK